MISNDFLTGMQVVARLPDILKRAESDSLSEYSAEARVEPPVLVEDATLGLPYLTDILHVANSLYSAYYLQAWTLSSVSVNGVNVRQVLNSLNDRRRPMSDVGGLVSMVAMASDDSIVSSVESYEYGLPSFEARRFKTSDKDDDPKIDERTPSTLNATSRRGTGRDVSKAITENGNLAVGRVLEVKVADGRNETVVPVTIRLNTSTVPSDVLTHILSVGSEDTSAKARYHGFKSGRLRLLEDVILQQDLMEKHKNALMRDTSGYLREVSRKRRTNQLSAALSLTPSVATASTIVIATKELINKVSAQYGSNIENDERARHRLFKNSYTTLLFVIDREWEQVDIYHRGIDKPTELSIRELKSASKGSGPDIGQIMEAYQLGRNVTV